MVRFPLRRRTAWFAAMPASHSGVPGAGTLPAVRAAGPASVVGTVVVGVNSMTIGQTSTAPYWRRGCPGQPERLVEVLGLEHVVATGHLGALGERAVGDHGASGPPVMRTPVAEGCQRVTASMGRPSRAGSLVCRHLGRQLRLGSGAVVRRPGRPGARSSAWVSPSGSEWNPVFHSLPDRRTTPPQSDRLLQAKSASKRKKVVLVPVIRGRALCDC